MKFFGEDEKCTHINAIKTIILSCFWKELKPLKMCCGFVLKQKSKNNKIKI